MSHEPQFEYNVDKHNKPQHIVSTPFVFSLPTLSFVVHFFDSYFELGNKDHIRGKYKHVLVSTGSPVT